MATKYVLFAPENKAAALDYEAWCTLNNPDAGNSTSWSLQPDTGEPLLDSNGNWLISYLGPPHEYPVGTVFEEPVGGPAMRATGILVDKPNFPPDPEE